ncbi:carbamoyltransferase [Verrucomicrobiota bacterium]
MNILGISAYYHDSAAALVKDGKIIAAAQEERFTRIKQDASFPENAIRFCLDKGDVSKLDAVAFYDKPILKFARILETYFGVAPYGLRSFMMAMPIWLKQKLWIPVRIETSLKEMGFDMPHEFYFPEHHESHAASAFFPSPFEDAAILNLDGVGEWATTSMGIGENNNISLFSELRFPHSLGLLYSAFTYFVGFKVNSGEYKLMGLAPYGEPKYANIILDNLIDLREDGSFRLNMDYFGYLDGLTMTNKKFAELFGGPPRKAEAEITRREMDLAKSIQVVTEEMILKMACYIHKQTKKKNLCMAGGVALNCVANGRLLRESPFENIWIQPAAGDAGGALGAAMFTWHVIKKKARTADGVHDSMNGSYLGPEFADSTIQSYMENNGYPFLKLSEENRSSTIAHLIGDQKVIGLFQGRMEFGPRALGNRSIIGDARSPEMQSIMNLKIKYRESFRPFAPSCLEERVGDYFDMENPSPYMLLVGQVKEDRLCGNDKIAKQSFSDIINTKRSDIPAVTHVDCSARIQTVSRETNSLYYDIIQSFEQITGCGVIINTSFNVRGEPVVCTPADAYRCFMRTEMDYLVMGSFLLDKKKQPAWKEAQDWRNDFELD